MLPIPTHTEQLHNFGFRIHEIEEEIRVYEKRLSYFEDSEKRETGLMLEITSTLLGAVREVKRASKAEKEFDPLTVLAEKIDEVIAPLKERLISNFSTLMTERDTIYLNEVKYDLNEGLGEALLAEYEKHFDRKVAEAKKQALELASESLKIAKKSLKQLCREQNQTHEEMSKVKASICQELQSQQEKYSPELEQLMKKKEDLFKEEPTDVFTAVYYGKIEYVKEEMNKKSSWWSWSNKKSFVDQTYPGKESSQFTMLHTAAHIGCLPIVQLLCTNGADIFKTDDQGYSAIHWAAKAGRYHVVKYLLERDKRLVDAKGEYDRTPLMMAVYNLHYEVAELLIQNGAMLNAQTNVDGRKLTALHYAVEKQHIHLVQLLLSDPTLDVDLKDVTNTTPLKLAVSLEHPILVEEILKHSSCFKSIGPTEPSGLDELVPMSKSGSKIREQLMLKMAKKEINYGRQPRNN